MHLFCLPIQEHQLNASKMIEFSCLVVIYKIKEQNITQINTTHTHICIHKTWLEQIRNNYTLGYLQAQFYMNVESIQATNEIIVIKYYFQLYYVDVNFFSSFETSTKRYIEQFLLGMWKNDQ